MTKSLHRHYRRFGERMTEEMGLQTFPENRYWRRRRDVQRQSVPQSGSSDRNSSSIADGWKTGASENKYLTILNNAKFNLPVDNFPLPNHFLRHQNSTPSIFRAICRACKPSVKTNETHFELFVALLQLAELFRLCTVCATTASRKLARLQLQHLTKHTTQAILTVNIHVWDARSLQKTVIGCHSYVTQTQTYFGDSFLFIGNTTRLQYAVWVSYTTKIVIQSHI